MARHFDIGDVVEIHEESRLAEVVGVIHDSERLFVWFKDTCSEKEFAFSAVTKQWRELTSNAEVHGRHAVPCNELLGRRK